MRCGQVMDFIRAAGSWKRSHLSRTLKTLKHSQNGSVSLCYLELLLASIYRRERHQKMPFHVDRSLDLWPAWFPTFFANQTIGTTTSQFPSLKAIGSWPFILEVLQVGCVLGDLWIFHILPHFFFISKDMFLWIGESLGLRPERERD